MMDVRATACGVPDLCPHVRQPSQNTTGPPHGDPFVNPVLPTASTNIAKHRDETFLN